MSLLNNIYDDYRTARMNEYYYGKRLDAYDKINAWYEGFIAIGASTAIAGWTFWTQSVTGRYTWMYYTGVVAVLTAIKPFLKLQEKVERFTKLHTGYRALYLNLEFIAKKISRDQGVEPETTALYNASEEHHRQLALDDERNWKVELLEKCQARVLHEIPTSSLWYPPEREEPASVASHADPSEVVDDNPRGNVNE